MVNEKIKKLQKEMPSEYCLARFFLAMFRDGIKKDLNERGISLEDVEIILQKVITSTITAFNKTVVKNAMGELGILMVEREMENFKDALFQEIARDSEGHYSEADNVENEHNKRNAIAKSKSSPVHSVAPWVMYQ